MTHDPHSPAGFAARMHQVAHDVLALRNDWNVGTWPASNDPDWQALDSAHRTILALARQASADAADAGPDDEPDDEIVEAAGLADLQAQMDAEDGAPCRVTFDECPVAFPCSGIVGAWMGGVTPVFTRAQLEAVVAWMAQDGPSGVWFEEDGRFTQVDDGGGFFYLAPDASGLYEVNGWTWEDATASDLPTFYYLGEAAS